MKARSSKQIVKVVIRHDGRGAGISKEAMISLWSALPDDAQVLGFSFDEASCESFIVVESSKFASQMVKHRLEPVEAVIRQDESEDFARVVLVYNSSEAAII